MKKIFFLLLVMILASCQKKPEVNRDLKLLNTNIISLSATELLSDSIIESANIVAHFESYIIVRHYAENIFTIYNYNSNNNNIEQMGSFAKKGVGPNEFSGAAECVYDKRTGKLYLFDIKGGNNVKAYEVNSASLDNIFTEDRWQPIHFPKLDKTFITTFTPLSDTVFVALGGDMESTNLLSMVFLSNDSIGQVDFDFPSDGINVKPITKRFVYNYGRLLKHPFSNRFLYYCTNWGNYAEIVTFENKELVSSREIVANYPLYKVSPNGIESESEMQTLMGMESYVTDEYIYLLPNLRTKEEYIKENHERIYPSNHSNVIYTFDWEGNHVRTYRLDKSIREFVVSPNNSYLLASSLDPQSGDIVFLRFDI